MANRCAYKAGKRRCSRNGFGNPPLCRAHAIEVGLDGGRERDSDENSPVFDILELADRALSRSNNDFARQVGGIFGELLSGYAARARAPGEGQTQGQRPPPRRPQPAQAASMDPRMVLGFEPQEKLTEARIKDRKRQLAQLFHPDKPGGSISAMKRVNDAADALLKSL